MLGNMQLFREATLGPGGWTASELVQFVAYGSALVVFWLLAIRAADEIRGAHSPMGPIHVDPRRPERIPTGERE